MNTPLRDTIAEPDGRGRTILIIDDDPDNLAILSDYLEEASFKTLVAEDGESGLRTADYALPDLILLDIMMPGMDGFETCRRLKAGERTRDVPVIFMTALAETVHKVRGFEAGAVDYITKPFHREEILARTGVHLRIRELTGRLQDANETLEYRVKERTTELVAANRSLEAEVAERKRAEEALQLTRFSVDHAAVSAFLVDRDARILYVNEQACRALGYAREELLAMKVFDLDPDFSQPRWGDHWAQLRKEGVLHFETLQKKKDGTLIPIEISTNYLSFGDREYNWAFARDISERKAAEQSLKRSAELTRTIIDNMNDAISLIDVHTFRLVSVNSAFLNEYGFRDESEVTGKTCHEITHHRPDVCSAPDDICPLGETVRTGEHITVEHIHYGKDGEKKYVEVSTSPIKDENGNVVHVVHVQKNITERKRAEEALRESEERLVLAQKAGRVGVFDWDLISGKVVWTEQLENLFGLAPGGFEGTLRGMGQAGASRRSGRVRCAIPPMDARPGPACRVSISFHPAGRTDPLDGGRRSFQLPPGRHARAHDRHEHRCDRTQADGRDDQAPGVS